MTSIPSRSVIFAILGSPRIEAVIQYRHFGHRFADDFREF
jgi:hypothetical protein